MIKNLLFKNLFDLENIVRFADEVVDEEGKPVEGGGVATAPPPPATGDGTGDTSTPAEPPEPVEGSGKQPAKPDTEEVFDWTKDARYVKMWKKDPNGIYKSYRNAEKMIEPLKSELSELKKKQDEINALAKEFGITPEQLKEVLTEHKVFKDPNHVDNQRLGYLNTFLDNPVYQQEVVNFFNELEQKELQRLYPNMNAEQIKKQVELDNKVKELEAANEKNQHEKLVAQFSAELESNVDRAKKYAESRGFDFTDEIKNELLEYCDKNEIPTKYIYSTFVEKYSEPLDKAYADKVQQGQLQNLNKNKGSVTIPAKTKSPDGKPTGSLRERLSKAVEKMGIT
jgi:hypothetical protein